VGRRRRRRDGDCSLCGRIEAELGAEEILVNSAGILQAPLPPERLPMTTWDSVVGVDQRGTYVTCVAFGQRMAERRRGSIDDVADGRNAYF
jgi:NAD(P)-dependent dehydrogenase (short-subunit alcohol dehydrogenase family)